ncbi:MAG TPA: DUF6074 family protein [Terracidiphilus sp.]|jgi:hypothetical protein
MPEIIPFPLVGRHRIVTKIAKQAVRAASISHQAAHDWILESVRIQRDALLQKGVTVAVAEREAESLWDSLWRTVDRRSERASAK